MKSLAKITIVLILLSTALAKGQNKYSISGNNITKLNITFDHTVPAAPGYQIPMGITCVSDKKKGFTTKGMLGGKTKWTDFEIHADGGKFDDGYLIISKDVRLIKNHEVRFSASPKVIRLLKKRS